ncbi:MAG: formate dehydrogenase [Candidatus Methanomethylicota archaeon]|uniref:formate dehydrogenase (coenzyme F420) n=1 Tax=Thermoproteota archaeon TaxID=2056631 RepID=A0A497ES77_9CREN|nr:MAG: formate dehydrogenase [Candidatus Verstraetearchaeota archaeon]RLE53456.1 MAG: formate dehydrogenase [Candidatus Verstraetearchaeota archaeon]
MLVNVGDLYLGWAADKEIFEKSDHGGVVISLMRFALRERMADVAISIDKKEGSRFDVMLKAVDNPDEIKPVGSLHCVTPGIAKFLREYLDGAENKRVILVAKPCDAKAMIELAKRKQVNIDNVIVIGVNCTGTFRPHDFKKMAREVFGIEPEKVVSEEIEDGKLILKTSDGKQLEKDLRELEERGYGRRENCRRCETPIPKMADLAIGKWGARDKKSFIEVCSTKGAELLKKAIEKGVIFVEKAPEESIKEREEKYRRALEEARYWQRKTIEHLEKMKLEERLEYWTSQFRRCIKCMGCRDSCPLCYCMECMLEAWRGYVKAGELPPDRLFPIMRIAHVADSCVNCGQCEDACMMEIPITSLLFTVNSKIREVFKYEAGMRLEEKPPLISVTDKELKIPDVELKPGVL